MILPLTYKQHPFLLHYVPLFIMEAEMLPFSNVTLCVKTLYIAQRLIWICVYKRPCDQYVLKTASVCVTSLSKWMEVCMRLQAWSLTGQGHVLSVHWMRCVSLSKCVKRVRQPKDGVWAANASLFAVVCVCVSLDHLHELRGTCLCVRCGCVCVRVCWVCRFLLLI